MNNLQDIIDSEGFIPDSVISDIKALPAFHREDTDGINRLDNLSYKFYGDVDLWWVIAIYNNIIDPTNYSEELLEVYAPSKDDVNAVIVKYKTEGSI